jgi:hypothetical protein
MGMINFINPVLQYFHYSNTPISSGGSMSKQANKTVIGIFVVGAIALVVVAIVVLGSGKFFRQTLKAVCYFEGSVGGLNIGAPVVFRGVKIGSVTNVILRFDRKDLIFTIPVFIEIDPSKMVATGPEPKNPGENLKLLVDRGLRASLEMQSIVTGQMQVGLDFQPDKPAKFKATIHRLRKFQPFLHRCRSWPKRLRSYRSKRSSTNYHLPLMGSTGWRNLPK